MVPWTTTAALTMPLFLTQEDKGGEQVYPSEDPSEVDGGVGGNATLRSRLECIKRTDRYPKGEKVKQTRKVIQEVSCDINFTFLSHYYYSSPLLLAFSFGL